MRGNSSISAIRSPSFIGLPVNFTLPAATASGNVVCLAITSSSVPRETLAALRTEQLWDVLGVRLNGPKAEGKRIVLNWNFTDTKETFVLNLENSALTYVAGSQAADAHASFTLARSTLDEVIAKLTTFPEAVGAGKITFTGEPLRLGELMMMMDEFPRMFEIVEPKRTAVS